MLQKVLMFSVFCVFLFTTYPGVCEDVAEVIKKSDGVCYTFKNVTRNVTVIKQVEYYVDKKVEDCGYFQTCQKRVPVCCRNKTEIQEVADNIKERSCCLGYINVSNFCIPHCSQPCLNGKCVKPETCACLDGYKFNKNSTNECKPICSKPCVNGVCEKPETCTCKNGYSLKNKSTHECEPKCSRQCKNGFCSAPETCTCKNGYKHAKDAPFSCEPICSKSCINGVCSAPEMCTCNKGSSLKKSSSNECEPICKDRCINGYCAAPETCKCFAGYEQNSKFACNPICSEHCINGKCTAPEICECNPGYKLKHNSKHECEPVCMKPCINGTCTEPEKCACKLGYSLKENSKHFCEPRCKNRCIHGDCVAPDVCKCDNGYKLKKGSKHECELVCPPGFTIKNGVCIEDSKMLVNDEATCEEGYRKDNNTDKCIPYCSNCNNGQCTNPNECTCFDGYYKRRGTCKPACTRKCINGYCSQPNKCTCQENYTLSPQHWFLCEPTCANCVNGQCISPGECSCSKGFQRMEESCVPLLETSTILSNSTSQINDTAFAAAETADVTQSFIIPWTAIPIAILIIVTIALKVYACRRKKPALLKPSKNDIRVQIYASDELLLEELTKKNNPVTYL